jgi:CBS domain-containing protein
MTPYVVSVLPDQSVFDAAKLMLEKKISGLPVVDDTGNLVGIVTEGDFLRRAEIGTKRQRPRWVEFFMGPGRLADEYVRISGRA